MVKNLLHIYSAGAKCQWCEDRCMSLNISGPISCPLFLSLWKPEESSKRRANYTVQDEMSGQLLRDHTRSSLFWLSRSSVAQVDIRPLGLRMSWWSLRITVTVDSSLSARAISNIMVFRQWNVRDCEKKIHWLINLSVLHPHIKDTNVWKYVEVSATSPVSGF